MASWKNATPATALLGAILGVILGAGLAGCGGQAGEPSAGTPGGSAAPPSTPAGPGGATVQQPSPKGPPEPMGIPQAAARYGKAATAWDAARTRLEEALAADAATAGTAAGAASSRDDARARARTAADAASAMVRTLLTTPWPLEVQPQADRLGEWFARVAGPLRRMADAPDGDAWAAAVAEFRRAQGSLRPRDLDATVAQLRAGLALPPASPGPS